MFRSIFLIGILFTASGDFIQNPDGSLSLPDKNNTVGEDEYKLTLVTNITFPADTTSVQDVSVWIYDGGGNGGRLLGGLVNTTKKLNQASPQPQVVQKLNLHEADIMLTSKLSKNCTTNHFQVDVIFSICLNQSTLYRHSHLIRSVVLGITSHGKGNHRLNHQTYFIWYTKSGIARPMNKAISYTAHKAEVITTAWQVPITTASLNTAQEDEGTTVLKHGPMKPWTTSGIVKSTSNKGSEEHISNLWIAVITVFVVVVVGVLITLICRICCKPDQAEGGNAFNEQEEESESTSV